VPIEGSALLTRGALTRDGCFHARWGALIVPSRAMVALSHARRSLTHGSPLPSRATLSHARFSVALTRDALSRTVLRCPHARRSLTRAALSMALSLLPQAMATLRASLCMERDEALAAQRLELLSESRRRRHELQVCCGEKPLMA
jgi:hypothetical protein